MSPAVFTEYTNQKEVMWQQYRLCLPIAEYQILGGKHFLVLGPGSGKIWWLTEGTIHSEERTTANGPSCVARKPKWIFP